jgi:hypothetical protein
MPRKKTRKQYSDESRKEAVNLVIVGGSSAAKVARKMRINPNTLRDWVRQARGEQKPVAALDDSIDIREVSGVTNDREASQCGWSKTKHSRKIISEVAPRLIAFVTRKPQDGHMLVIEVPRDIYKVIIKVKHRGKEIETVRAQRHYNPYRNEVVLSSKDFPDDFKTGYSALKIYVLDKPSALAAGDPRVETVLSTLANKLPGMISRALSEALA